MAPTFCTIITENYIHYALALYESLSKNDGEFSFFILICDQKNSFDQLLDNFNNIQILNPDEVCIGKHAQTISEKYQKTDMDRFRWCMKPIVINYLLKNGHEQVFFLDPDLYFFNNFKVLSDELKGHNVLLTPHWRASNPYEDPLNFGILQTNGLFNAGFIGVSKSGSSAMEWWSSVCAYECVKAIDRGLFDDQAYLDLMPIYYEKVKVLRHKGCNIANWNQIECKRTLSQDGRTLINNNWEIVFIHFTKSTINGILSSEDSILKPHLEQYQAALKKFSLWIPEKYRQHTQKSSQLAKVNFYLNQKIDGSRKLVQKIKEKLLV